MSTESQSAYDAFERHYGGPAYWIASAPGRVNLIGEYTDFNDGFVLPMAIERRTVIAAATNGTDRIVVHSEAMDETVEIDLSERLVPKVKGRWGNYFTGVVAGFLEAGLEVPGFDALIQSNVPLGGGLSSSAALETSTATLLEAMSGIAFDPIRKVLLCQAAEHAFAGMPCGIMDPYICSLGRKEHALLLDCRSQTPEWILLDDPSVAVLIINTNVKHALAGSLYAVRRKACEEAARIMDVPSLREADMGLLSRCAGRMEETAFRCARHVIGETARTERAAEYISKRQWLEVGRLLDASHESLKTDFNVSCAELDAVVAAAREIGLEGGVFGARLTGGGFGGCVVALIEAHAQEIIRKRIVESYRCRTGILASTFVSRPADGASVMEI